MPKEPSRQGSSDLTPHSVLRQAVPSKGDQNIGLRSTDTTQDRTLLLAQKVYMNTF